MSEKTNQKRATDGRQLPYEILIPDCITMTNGNGSNESRLDRVERILEGIALRQDAISQQQALLTQQLLQTRAIADSNARSIQSWEARINQVEEEAEEERSQLRVDVNRAEQERSELRAALNELIEESRENIAQHLTFRGEIQDLRDRMDRE